MDNQLGTKQNIPTHSSKESDKAYLTWFQLELLVHLEHNALTQGSTEITSKRMQQVLKLIEVQK